MTRTTITRTAHNEVTLISIDPMSDESIRWVFWIPTNGGYVREGENHTADDKQVCERLNGRGNTLTAEDGDDLLRTIRREWKAYRELAKKELAY
jgi:hypothetical protein